MGQVIPPPGEEKPSFSRKGSGGRTQTAQTQSLNVTSCRTPF